MKKRDRMILIFGIILIILLISIIIWQVSQSEIGPGTGFELHVIEGCDIILALNADQSPVISNITFNDELIDKIVLEYGFERSGFKKSGLRQYCDDISNKDLCLEKNKMNDWNCKNIPSFDECIRSNKGTIIAYCVLH